MRWPTGHKEGPEECLGCLGQRWGWLCSGPRQLKGQDALGGWGKPVKLSLENRRSCPCVLSHLSCPTLCDPMDGSPPGSSVSGISIGSDQRKNLPWDCNHDHIQRSENLAVWYVGEQTPTLVALGTSLVEDSFSKTVEMGYGLGMVQVCYIYYAMAVLTGSRAERELRQ